MPDIDIVQGRKCPYCGCKTKFVESSIIYGKSYGMVYHCLPCKAWVGVHSGTKKALGRLANAELREYKKEAHRLFDELWKKKVSQGYSKHISRSGAYKWLSEQMNIDPKYTHIGMFDVEQCKMVIELCKKYFK